MRVSACFFFGVGGNPYLEKDAIINGGEHVLLCCFVFSRRFFEFEDV